MLLAIWSASKEQTAVLSTPSGWTKVGSSSPSGTGSNGRSTVWRRNAGSDPVAYTFPGAAGGLVVALLVLSGADPAGTFVGPSWDSDVPRQVVIPTLSGVAAGGLVVSTAAVLYGPAATTWTWSGATSKLADGSGARYQRFTVGTQSISAAGSSGPAVATSSQTPDTYGETTQAMSLFVPSLLVAASTPGSVTQAIEPDTAVVLRPTGSFPLGRADQVDSGFDLNAPVRGSRNVVAAVEGQVAAALRPTASNAVVTLPVEADTAFTLRPTGSYPTAPAVERQLALKPTNPNVSSDLALALADAVSSPERWLNPSGVAFWNGTTDTTQPFVTLDTYLSEVTIRRSLEGDLPAEVGLVEGHAAAQAEFVLEGQLDSTGVDVVDAFAPYKPDAYFYGKPVIGTNVVLGSTFLTQLGQAATVQFTGSVASVSPSSADRKVTLTALDGANKLRAPVSLSPHALDSLLLARYGPASYNQLINSQWLIDFVLRANGVFSSPPPPSGYRKLFISATFHGSQIPEVGFGSPPQQYNSIGVSSGQAPWITTGHPYKMLYANPAVAGLQGTLTATDSYTFTSRSDPIGVSCLMRMPLASDRTVGGILLFIYCANMVFGLQRSAATGEFSAVFVGNGTSYTGASMYYFDYTANPITTVNYTGETVAGVWARANMTVSLYDASNLVVKANISSFGVTKDINIATIYPLTYLDTAPRPGNVRVQYNAALPITNLSIWTSITTNVNGRGFAYQPTSSFVSQATLDVGSNTLWGVPAIQAEDSWDLLKEIVAAEYGSIGFSPSGTFWFRARSAVRSASAPEVISSTRTLADLATSTSEASLRNEVTGSYVPVLVGDFEDVFSTSDVAQLDCGVGTTTFDLNVPDGTTVAAPAGSYWRLSGAGWGSANSYAYRDAIRCCIVSSAAPTQELADASKVTMNVQIVRPGVVRLRINNQTAISIRFATPDVVNSDQTTTYGQPAFAMGGRVVREQDGSVVTLADVGSQVLYGRRAYELSGAARWRQTNAAVSGIAAAVIATTAQPVPVLEAIETSHDPRRVLQAPVTVIDAQGLGQVQGTIVGIETTMRRDQPAVDRLDVRPIGPPGLGVLDDPQLGVVGSTLVFGA